MFHAGDKMQRQVVVDHQIGVVYTCPACNTLMKDFTDHFKDDYEDEFYNGCVQEAMIETIEFLGKTPEEFLEYLKK